MRDISIFDICIANLGETGKNIKKNGRINATSTFSHLCFLVINDKIDNVWLMLMMCVRLALLPVATYYTHFHIYIFLPRLKWRSLTKFIIWETSQGSRK